jgi:Fe2+ or Zn2+ uptake regulation protein
VIRLDSKIKKSFNDIISHPSTTSVFLYLKNQNRPVGVREVQKALNFNNPSTAYWHLNKLRDNGIINQLQNDKYQVHESYQDIKKIPLTVTLDHYILTGKNIPEIVILLTF